jgi:hypothetical protein
MARTVTILNAEAIRDHVAVAPTLEAFGRSLVQGALLAAAETITAKKSKTGTIELGGKITVSGEVSAHDPSISGGCYKVCVVLEPRPATGAFRVCWWECWGTRSS